MAAKEIKSLLKSARTALDRQDHEEAIKHCEAILWSDSGHYLANIFAGKANLSLGNVGRAKEHYIKATTINDKEPLAWKGLVDLFDKHNTDGTEADILTALSAYETILPIQSDEAKKIAVISKLISLYKRLKKNEKVFDQQCKLAEPLSIVNTGFQACTMYDMLLESGPPLHLVKESIIFLLHEGAYSRNRWLLIKDSYGLLIEGVANSENIQLNNSYINGLMKWIKLLESGYEEIVEHVKEYCQLLIQNGKGESRSVGIRTLCIVELWDILKSTSQSDRCNLQPLNDYQMSVMSEGAELSDCYKAIVLITNNKTIKEACQLANKVALDSSNVCEYRVVACLCHMKSHDYHMTIANANEGLRNLFEAPLFLQVALRRILYICLIEALLCKGQFDKALDKIEKELCHSQASCDYHVTELHIRALLGCNRIQEAKQISSSFEASGNVAVHLYKGLISMALCDYESAINGFQLCVQAVPMLPRYLYYLGACLLSCPTGDKRQAYQHLIKAAQLDPFNPYVYLQLGHYQRNVMKDLNRAVKCYQKSFITLSGPVTAGLALAEVYTTLQDEESAFSIYNKVITQSLPSQCKEAWLRVGLYHRKQSRYEEAIKCFLTVLRQDSADSHVWECIGEAYQMRGSQNSSLKSFCRATEINPKSLYCHYQIASIQHSLGLLSNAIDGYMAVLEIDCNYVPALKGRAEVYYNLALDSLEMAFDQKAVDYISLAIKDISLAVSHCSAFLSLWKLLGDCCLSLSPITSNLVNVTVSSSLFSGNHGDLAVEKAVNKLELLQLAISCYGKAIQLDKDHTHLSPILHNMALVYKAIAKEDLPNELQNLTTSLELIKKTVSLSPSNHHYWNTLGVIASHPLLATPTLAQHAFIKSLTIEPNNAVAWSNIGSLYLINGNIQLAHSAFEKAQSCDPTHVEGWVGDGLVAETIGKSDEAMNFFHISSEIKYHSESAMGFAQWVCHTLSTSKMDGILSPCRISLNNSTHLKTTRARDGLIRYTLRHPHDPSALNLLALLYEQEGQLRLAEQTLRRARQILLNDEGGVNDDSLIIVMKNHARLLRSNGELKSSLATYETLNDRGIPLSIEQALTLHTAGIFYEAAIAYEDMMTSYDVTLKPYLILGGAMSLFGDKNTDDCKIKLFKVFQTPPPIVHGMISLAVFAGYLNDTTLLQATLHEIGKMMEIDCASIDKLHPSCNRVLRSLRHYLSNNNQNTELLESLICKFPIHEPLPVIQDILKDIIDQTPDQSLCTIQKIIRNYPDNVWVWSLLSYVLLVLGKAAEAKTCLQITIFKAKLMTETIQASSKLLQLKTNSLQTVQLLLAWSKQLHNIL